MISSKLIKISSLVGLAVLLANCSARDIVKEANPALDPTPVFSSNADKKKAVDPLAQGQWNLDKISARGDASNAARSGSKRIVVAILGTGVDYTHEDLVDNIYVNQNEWKTLTPGTETATDGVDDDKNGYADDFIGYDFIDNDGLPFDRNGAGTAMAGVIGAATNNGLGITGLVENVSIMPVRYIDASGQMLLPDLFKALRYAQVMKVDVILLHTPTYTFGNGGRDAGQRSEMARLEREMLKKSLGDIQTLGIPIVASAGNSGDSLAQKNSLIEELSKYPNVVVVTSVDDKDARPFIANYSRERVHTSAPGKEILTTLPGNRYGKVSSTSVAAAHVAGALALALDKQYGRQEPRRLVEAFIKPEASDAVDNLLHETIGGNRLNLTKYLNYFEK